MKIQSITASFSKTMQVDNFEPAVWRVELTGTPTEGDTIQSASEELFFQAKKAVKEEIVTFYKDKKAREKAKELKKFVPQGTSFDPVSEAIEPTCPSAKALAFAADMTPDKVGATKNGYSKRTYKKKEIKSK